MLSGGHLLLGALPDVGKTTLAKGLAHQLGLRSTKIQFTSDLPPSEITGGSIFDTVANEFRVHRGPIVTQLAIADEINRTTPRTQSALLEAMSVRNVSLEGHTYPLDPNFTVIARQNPSYQTGTYPPPRVVVRPLYDAINYEWQRSIMNYQYEQQATVLKALLSQVTSYRILLLLCLAVFVTVSPMALWITWKRIASYRDLMSRKLRWLDRELRKRGVIRRSGDTLRQAYARLSFKDAEDEARFENDICEFERLYYANKAP